MTETEAKLFARLLSDPKEIKGKTFKSSRNIYTEFVIDIEARKIDDNEWNVFVILADQEYLAETEPRKCMIENFLDSHQKIG